MVTITQDLILFLNILYVSDGIRRIKDGAAVTVDKPYVVYLVKAPNSDKRYDSWVCGGALVSTLFIVTSAACVDDVEYLYAIAGYNKYVTDDQIDTDPCTKAKKKKVVYTCVPMKYELRYDKLEKWSFIDIGLVKVESAYDLNDASYKTVCSYIPNPISINYEPRYQETGTDALVFGWGHTNMWRKPDDSNNYNQEFLRYASTKIMEKNQCKREYYSFPNMSEIIDQFMICTLEKGDFDENGQLYVMNDDAPKLNGCSVTKLLGLDDVLCEQENGSLAITDLTRKNMLRSNDTSNVNSNDTPNVNLMINRTHYNQKNKSRKSGICQNDHGGPLVTWVGAYEVLIGVASVFKVSDESECEGPYLFTSTQCNGAFLDCILSASDKKDKIRRAICDKPPIQRGYDTVERFISWKHHPAGAADNEVDKKHVVTNKNNTIRGHSKTKQQLKLKNLTEHKMFSIRPQRPLSKE